MWTLANHPRVPAADPRRKSAAGEIAATSFPTASGWSHQLYVREARRMVSDYVMTQHDCQGRRVAEDSVGLAAYGMDSHNTQRYVDASGHARNEGDVQVGGFAPYPISYRALVPRAAECTNLLVPGLPVRLAHRLRVDPHGAGVHGAGPVGRHGRLPVAGPARDVQQRGRCRRCRSGCAPTNRCLPLLEPPSRQVRVAGMAGARSEAGLGF